ILVAAFIVNEQDELAVTTPKKLADRASRLVGQRPRVGEGLVCAFDPNVQCTFIGFEEGDKPSVGRNLRPGDFRIAKQHFTVDEWRQPALCERGYAEQKNKRKHTE